MIKLRGRENVSDSFVSIHQLISNPNSITDIHKVKLDIPYMVLITCKKCRDFSYLTSEALGNLTNFGFECP